MTSFFLYLTVTLFIIVCCFLILLVLIQKGRGGGLASAFGGGGGGNTAFGSKTGDVLTWATSIVFGVFLLLAIAANLMFTRYEEQHVGNASGSVTPVQQPAPTPTPQGSGDGLPAGGDNAPLNPK